MLLVAPPHSYRIFAYHQAASALGVELTVASQGRHSLVAEIAKGLQIELDEPAEAVRIIHRAGAEHPFDAIVATDDAAVEIASRGAAALGLAHNPAGAARTARRKDLARAALARAGLPVPEFRRIDLRGDLGAQLEGVSFPCVVKPLAMAGSRGVIRADSPAELQAACRRVSAIVAEGAAPEEREHLLVESFLPGREIAIEGLLRGGALDVLAIFDKPDPLDGPYFEETYYITPSRLAQPLQRHAAKRVEQACAAYGLREGPVHAELRIDRGEAWLLEIAARTIGGDCARLLTFGAGQSLEELVLCHALGRPLDTSGLEGAAGVLMIPIERAGTLRRVEGVLAARRVPGIEEVVIAVREGYELVPLPEGGSYLGFLFARGDTPEEVEVALRAARDHLKVIVAASLPLSVG